MFRGPVFVVGRPRSGTKLLRALLNGHSAISIPFWESNFIPKSVAKAKEFGVDTEVLEKQSKYNDAFEWLKMPLAGRKCVFLEDGVCGIYEDRPLSCRNYRVTGESKKCDTGKGNILVAQVLYPLAEWVHCVAMSLNGGTQESMAYGINKRLKSNRV